MGSSSKRRTTMAKLQRENRLREKRMEKQERKEARKRAAAEPHLEQSYDVSFELPAEDAPVTDES